VGWSERAVLWNLVTWYYGLPSKRAVNINWTAFGTVFVASFGAAIAVIVLFSLGVANLSPIAWEDDVKPSRSAQAGAALCFLACAVVVAYGLYIVIRR
jgi:hypothetical protein